MEIKETHKTVVGYLKGQFHEIPLKYIAINIFCTFVDPNILTPV